MLVSIFLICLATFVNGKACENNQFWSSILESCENCSRCVSPDIVLRPCQRYADTVCGPLSELNIDWTWLTHYGHHASKGGKHGNKKKEMMDTFRENYEEIREHELNVKNKQNGHHASMGEKHGKKKEMMDAFRENYKEIREHELNVKNKQKYLKRKHNKESDESSEEIESGDIFVGNRLKSKKDAGEEIESKKHKFQGKHRTLEEKLLDDVPSMNGRSRNHLESPEANMKLWQKLLRARADNPRMHFNDEEAFELLKSSRKEETKENDTYDPNHLKFDKNGILVKNFGFTKIEEDVKMEKLVDDVKFTEDFSTTEKFFFDWQTVILGMAVSSCIIFFLVAAIYSIQHAKNWKKLKNYFDADVEELQSWISSKKSDNKIVPSGIYKATTEVVHTEGSQCKYLERIIKMNSKGKMNFVKGNVYEKDNNKRSSELKPLTKKYPLVHKKTDNRI